MSEGRALRPSACLCGAVDVHSHVVPQDFPSYLGSKTPPQWPSMAPAHECHRSVMIDGKLYRTVSDRAWTTAKRLADLPGMGLNVQAISAMPELLSYWMGAPDAQQLLRFINEQIAAMVHESAGALVGLGAVPLQDMDLAIAELRYVMGSLEMAGVEVGSNINGVPIGHPSLDPFFEACEALDAAVFVHALKPTGMDRLVGPAPLQQVLGYPTDVGLAAASAITGNLMSRRPRLRIAFSHGGGTLATLLPRLEQGWKIFPALAETITCSPVEQARKFYYDSLVFDERMLQTLVATFGASQLMLGTDYPFNFYESSPVARVVAAGFNDEIAAQLVRLNAQKFLGIGAKELQ
jgi:aminocarboxymuconate-semialdehyde decarboxylase